MRKAVIGFLCLLSGILHATLLPGVQNESYYFEKLDISNGLSQNTVNAILQDRVGFMWFGTKDGLNRYDGHSFRLFKKEYGNPNSLGNNLVTALLEDRLGYIWVGTDAGLYIYNPNTESFSFFHNQWPDGNLLDRTVTHLLSDKYDNIWIVVETQGIYCYNVTTGEGTAYMTGEITKGVRTLTIDSADIFWISFYPGGLFYSEDNLKTLIPFTNSRGEEVFHNEIISRVIEGTHNRLYLGSEKEGLKEVNLSTGEVKRLPLSTRNELIFVRDILAYSDNELWIGGENGIYKYTISTGKTQHLVSELYDEYSLSDNAVYSLYKDREEGIWIGTYFGGINYLPRQYTFFSKYYPTGRDTDIQGRRVREICEAPDGTLWIGTEDNGLYNFDPVKKTFSFFEPSRGFNNVHGLAIVGDDLWVGTFSKGIKVINKNKQLVKTYLPEDKPGSLADNSVFTICHTTSGDVYVGTLFGLQRYRKETDDFERIEELDGIFIYDIKEDSRGNIWLGTYISGVYMYNINKKKWFHFQPDYADENSLQSHKISGIFEDQNRDIWITTQGGGFSKYIPSTHSFVTYNSKNGFPSDVVYQIIQDDDRYFWITTNSGLFRFNPDDQSTELYTTANGLLSNQFNYKSSYKAEDGTLYFGCIEGLISFSARNFTPNKVSPSVVITDFFLFNRKVEVGEPDSPLKQSITNSDKITLGAGQNSFSFRIATLNYREFFKNQFMYKLEGFDREWNIVTESPLITFSNLNHGSYKLRIKGAGNNGMWDDKEKILDIRILPPFYLTYWAYALYLILLSGVVAGLFLYIRNRNRSKQDRMIELFNQEKERELHNSKIEFFTNVAHEIRTPLTLIKGPLDNILKNPDMKGEVMEDLHIMSKNTSRLLDLTNQLLDFRKTEIRGFHINYIECNITELLQETYTRFRPLQKQKGLQFILDIPALDFMAHVDKEAFTKIISNLFNNAIKYADSLVKVQMAVPEEGDDIFEIRIENDGTIIPADMREEIFKPFVRMGDDETNQSTVGTGIGLALARSLAELHQGRLYMEDKTDMNSFRLCLPVSHDQVIKLAPHHEVIPEHLTHSSEPVSADNSRATVLVVEDNPEMQTFIARQLSPMYNVFTAFNGLEALKILDTQYINLVVCDILMPVMDGYEFCRKIKSDITYSHTPIILLTAKTNIQSKVEGMEAGADAYIEKPFSNDYLQACIANLLQSRASLRDSFTQSPLVKATTMAATRQDEEFINKLVEMIDENMKNPNFSIDDMAETFFMSRSSFYRKIKGIVGMSPNEFLRLERLKKAAALLKQEDTFINEVCYMVGFNSPSYFSKCFFKQFGILPKEYADKK